MFQAAKYGAWLASEREAAVDEGSLIAVEDQSIRIRPLPLLCLDSRLRADEGNVRINDEPAITETAEVVREDFKQRAKAGLRDEKSTS